MNIAINDIFKEHTGLYFLNTKNNIMEYILEIKKRVYKKREFKNICSWF